MQLSLLEKQDRLQRPDVMPTLSLGIEAFMEVVADVETVSPLENKLLALLSQVGLKINPFEEIDAGKDPLIPFYLIDHNQFEKISRDRPSFVFAPAGGGKTAFRVRLARECRAGTNGRRILPIVYTPTEPGDPNEDREESARRQRTNLLRSAAQELFLHLAYYPYVLDEMDKTLKKSFLQTISWDLDFSIPYYLLQMKEEKSLEPLINSFDPTARSLPNPPGKEDILYLHKKLSHYFPEAAEPDSKKRLEILFDLILNKLRYEAVYILVDGVDAFFETVNNMENAIRSISWLLDNTLAWTRNHIYVKYFLPIEMHAVVRKTPAFRLLTSKSNIIKIKWDADALSEVIRQRLQESSGGKFDSLTAFSDRALRASGRSPEEVMIGELRRHKKLSPRSLIRTVNRLFTNHVQDERVQEKLTPQDLTEVCEWIRREYSAKK